MSDQYASEIISASRVSEREIIDFDTIRPEQRREMWRDLVAFLLAPADSCLMHSLDRGQHDEEWKRKRYARKMERAELRKELRGTEQR